MNTWILRPTLVTSAIQVARSVQARVSRTVLNALERSYFMWTRVATRLAGMGFTRINLLKVAIEARVDARHVLV